MAKNREKLMVIDGNALVHRSFHALPQTMMTKEGVVGRAFCVDNFFMVL